MSKTIFIAFLLAIIFDWQAVGQEVKPVAVEQPITILIDSFARVNGEDRSAKFDHFFNQIQNNADSKGYVLVYCGKVCRYGEVESHLRGIELKIALEKFSRDRLVVVNGGYKEAQEVEFWLVPTGACPPSPSATVNIRDVTFMSKAAALVTPYDCCDDYEKLWRRLKP